MLCNIIFDFGNVLFDLDLSAFEREMKKLLGDNFAEARAKLRSNHVFELYETGGISTPEFVQHLCHTSTPPLSEAQVTAAWNAIFIGMPSHRFDMLLALRKNYKVFLLSNINDLHERWIADYMVREHNISEYETRYFDGVYFSHLIRLRKPTREAFEYVLADAELMPGETMFLDDLPENVEAAQSLGILGVWHEPGTEIADRLLEIQRNER